MELTSQRAHVAISMVDSDTKDAALMVRRESAKDRAVVASIVSSVTDRIKATFDLDIATSLPTKWDRPAVY